MGASSPFSKAAAEGRPKRRRREAEEDELSVEERRRVDERRKALRKVPSERGPQRRAPPPRRLLRRRRPFGPGRGGEPVAIVFGKARFAAPGGELPGLRRVDEMQDDRLEPGFEVDEKEIAHEIVARRQRRETSLERRDRK